MCRMKQNGDRERKELETKLAIVFEGQMNQLSTELREILIDDLVTAFENRLNVLKNIGAKKCS